MQLIGLSVGRSVGLSASPHTHTHCAVRSCTVSSTGHVRVDDQSNLTKVPNQGGSDHCSVSEVRDNLNKSLVVRLDLCFDRIRKCNVG